MFQFQRDRFRSYVHEIQITTIFWFGFLFNSSFDSPMWTEIIQSIIFMLLRSRRVYSIINSIVYLSFDYGVEIIFLFWLKLFITIMLWTQQKIQRSSFHAYLIFLIIFFRRGGTDCAIIPLRLKKNQNCSGEKTYSIVKR